VEVNKSAGDRMRVEMGEWPGARGNGQEHSVESRKQIAVTALRSAGDENAFTLFVMRELPGAVMKYFGEL